MEIDITKFAKKADPALYSNSMANSGLQNIREITWNNAKSTIFKFVTEENKQLFIDFFDDSGAWDDLNTWPVKDLNALFIQMVSGDLNEMRTYNNWEEIEKAQSEGQISGYIFKADDKIYFTLSH